MTNHNWLVTDDGHHRTFGDTAITEPAEYYRLYGTWGIVALLDGQECNRLWHRQPTANHPDRIAPTQDLILNPGDIVALTADAIHSVEPLGDAPTISFNLYGITNFQQRYEFDPDHHTAKLF